MKSEYFLTHIFKLIDFSNELFAYSEKRIAVGDGRVDGTDVSGELG